VTTAGDDVCEAEVHQLQQLVVMMMMMVTADRASMMPADSDVAPAI